MKKILFAVALAVSAIGAAAPSYADDMHHPVVHHHHRPVCHMVHVHGHLVKRCR
jgi:hypothetical protein